MFNKKKEENYKVDATPAITVKILSIKEGLTEYEDVEFVKILSKDYTLLIMKDYVPVIGEINGNLEIKTTRGIVKIENTTAYYIHKQNQFNLFIRQT